VLLLQSWGISDTATVWRASPALYYAAFKELVDRAEAEHGPWPLVDFDAKLVRALQLFGLQHRVLNSICCKAWTCLTRYSPLEPGLEPRPD
jgi:hypothetical protein